MTREQFEKVMAEHGYKVMHFWQDNDNGSIIARVYDVVSVYEAQIIEPTGQRKLQYLSSSMIHEGHDISHWFKEVDMAQSCVNGGCECNGCMSCQAEPIVAMRDTFGDPICVGDEYYEIDDEIITMDNLERWADDYETVVDEDMMDANCCGAMNGLAYMQDYNNAELFLGDPVYEFSDDYVYPDDLADWAADYIKVCEEVE